jgi:hypothetical protein
MEGHWRAKTQDARRLSLSLMIDLPMVEVSRSKRDGYAELGLGLGLGLSVLGTLQIDHSVVHSLHAS